MIRKRRLKNGIRVVSERIAHARSVSVGVWALSGSVSETDEESGASHFTEHMLFKGTATRSAQDIAREMDAIGGNLNAFTAKEGTCFYADVPAEHLQKACEVLSDIILNSAFDPEEFAKEKNVVMEEILMSNDLPEDVSEEEACRIFFMGDRLGKPVLGTRESVDAMTAEGLREYWKRRYVPQNLVVSCAGRFDPEEFAELAERCFGSAAVRPSEPVLPNAYPGGRRVSFIRRNTEQVYITFCMPGFASMTPESYALCVLSNAIGGNLSARLFQVIREQRGLAYTVGSSPNPSTTTGSFEVYAGTDESRAAEVTRLMAEELRDIRRNGISREEFLRGKEQARGSFILDMESPHAHMETIGRTALLQKREYTEAQILEKMDCVTIEQVEAVIPVVLDETNLCAAFAGRVGKARRELRTALGM